MQKTAQAMSLSVLGMPEDCVTEVTYKVPIEARRSRVTQAIRL